MSEEVVGIEKLKKFVKEAVETGKVINEALKDGFQVTDLWSIIMEGKDLSFVVTDWSTIKKEFNDLTIEEAKELVDALVIDLNITEKEVLDVIKNSIDFAEAGYALFVSIKALTDKSDSVVEG